MSTPKIAVTGMWSNRVRGMRYDGNAVSAAVLKSVVRAGGEPLIYFAEGPAPAAERLEGMHALLIPGGLDINPKLYGQEPDESVTLTDSPQQDQFEIEMIEAAIEKDLPILLICRGFQLFNVLRGGTMIQDLPKDSIHRDDVHPVSLDPESKLAKVMGETEFEVSSYHHQALDKIGTGLRTIATGPSEIPEALEDESANVIAVQWHPEDTADKDPKQAAIFDWLIENARKQMGKN